MEKEILEKLKNEFENSFGESRKPRYERACELFPEDMNEDRTSWDDMRDYADEMEYFIKSIRSIVYSE